jgi:hypothetical protein
LFDFVTGFFTLACNSSPARLRDTRSIHKSG